MIQVCRGGLLYDPDDKYINESLNIGLVDYDIRAAALRTAAREREELGSSVSDKKPGKRTKC